MKRLFLTALATLTLKPAEWKHEFNHTNEDSLTPQMRRALREVPKLKLKGWESVLDVGCGNGKTSAAIAKQWLPNGTIHGIDISESIISVAQQNKSTNASFEQACIFSYNPPKLFDAVVCFWVLYLFPNYSEALNKLLSFLKPGGKALICHIAHPGPPYIQLFSKTVPKEAIKFPTIKTIIKAAESSTAKIDYLEIKYNYDHFPNLNAFIEKCKAVPFFKLLPKEKEQHFFQQISETYNLENDGSVYDYNQVICMVLEKN